MQIHITLWLIIILLIGYFIGAKYPMLAQRVGFA
jgi:hypothetical protein